MNTFNNCQYVNTKNNYYVPPGVSYSQRIDSNFNQQPPLYELGTKDTYLKPYFTYTIGYTGEPDFDPNFLKLGTKMQGVDGSLYIVVRDFGENKWIFDESQCKDTFNYCGNINTEILKAYEREKEDIQRQDDENLCTTFNNETSCNNNSSLALTLSNVNENCPKNLKKICIINNRNNLTCGCYTTTAEQVKGIDYNCTWDRVGNQCILNTKN